MPAIRVENLSKQYKLGLTHAGSLRELASRWTNRIFGRKTGVSPLPVAGEGSGVRGDNSSFWALRDVSFDVQPGEVLGIIGRNGAGKSTLLKILSRITSPTSGRIEINGRVASLLEVGTGFHPELTGRENVYLNGAILGMTKAEVRRKFDEIVAFAEIDKFIDTPVKRYSSGMYVRLAFAVAAHLQPEILIVDEVLSVGDAEFQKKCFGKMSDVADGGRTVFFVSHNLDAIRKLCARALLLQSGHLAFDGTSAAALGRYLDSRVPHVVDRALPPPADSRAPGAAIRLSVHDMEGKLVTAFPIGKPWQIRVKFNLSRRLGHFVAGIGLVADGTTPVWTSWSEPHGLDAGNYEAIFSNGPVLLTAASYSIAVGLSSYNETFHYVGDSGVLDIVEGSGDTRGRASARFGFLLNSMQPQIRRVDINGELSSTPKTELTSSAN